MKQIWLGVNRWVMGLIRPVVMALFGNRTRTARYGGTSFRVKGDPSYLAFWRGKDPEELFLASLPLQGRTVYDVGAHIGVLSLFFGKAVGEAGRVISFEPNPRSQAAARENLELNKLTNVQIVGMGVGSSRGKFQLVFPTGRYGSGTMDANISQHYLQSGKAQAVDVDVDTLDSCIATLGLPKPDLIKIDVEGMESDVLQGMSGIMQERHPALYVEIHGIGASSKLASAEKVAGLVRRFGYSITHVESGQPVTDNIDFAKEGHLYCWHPTASALPPSPGTH